MEAAEFRRGLADGADLWNRHRFFEFHDHLEVIWKRIKHEKKREPPKDPRRDFVHGLILLAVAYHHWQMGNRIGLERKLREARALLAGYPGEYEGLDLAGFLEAATRDLTRGLRGDAYDPRRVVSLRFGGL